MAKPLDAEKCMAHARECVRLAGLTDDQEVRDQLIALARDWIVAARKEEEEEDDDDSRVLVFPSQPACREVRAVGRSGVTHCERSGSVEARAKVH